MDSPFIDLRISTLPIAIYTFVLDRQDIIAAPQFAIDDNPGAENYHMQAFDEAQDVILPRDIEVDDGFLTAGTAVSSHMIFLNTPGTTAGTDFDLIVSDVRLPGANGRDALEGLAPLNRSPPVE